MKRTAIYISLITLVVSIAMSIRYYNMCVERNIRMCGTVANKVDMTRYHKSKQYEQLVLIVDFPDKREDVTVNRLTYLSNNAGDRVCFMRSIADVYIDSMHHYQRMTLIMLIVVVISVLALICFMIDSMRSY